MDVRRKRLLFRCNHTGMKENDLLLGGFARAHLDGMNDAQIGRLEGLLAQPDPDIYDWITGRAAVPDSFDNDVLAMLRGFRFAPG